MTDHNMADRTSEQQYVATDTRLMDPPGNPTVDNHAGDNHAGDNHAGDNHAGDNHAGDNYAADNHATALQPLARPESYVQQGDDRHLTVRTAAVEPRLDRIRWSSVWAGLAVALALYLFLQLALVATGIVDLSQATSSDAWWSAGAAVVAFLVGGIVAGATAVWRDADDGLLHGIVMWAVGLVLLIALAAFGGSIALGSFDTSNVFDQFTNGTADATAASGDAKQAASWAIIGLTSALVASALGATIGSKMWPRRRTGVTGIDS